MRLITTFAVALAAILSLSSAFSPAMASPLDWPEEDAEMALHCAAVLQAYGHAYAVAADLSGQPSLPVSALPAPLVQLAGGAARLPDIAVLAEDYNTHAESVARTSFYPMLVGEGTPYLADDGRELVLAVQTCTARYPL